MRPGAGGHGRRRSGVNGDDDLPRFCGGESAASAGTAFCFSVGLFLGKSRSSGTHGSFSGVAGVCRASSDPCVSRCRGCSDGGPIGSSRRIRCGAGPGAGGRSQLLPACTSSMSLMSLSITWSSGMPTCGVPAVAGAVDGCPRGTWSAGGPGS